VIKTLNSTYLGGSHTEYAYAIAVDASGDAFVTGFTNSAAFPTTGMHASGFNSNASGSAFVTEFGPTGNVRYSTALGGSDYDYGTGVAVDASGDVFVTGYTQSTDFPTAGMHHSAANGDGQAFVTELNPATGALRYSTALGGTGYDYGTGIAVDASGDVFVTGETFSTDFPTAGMHASTANGNGQAFVTGLDPTTGALRYSTALGGTGYDQGNRIAVDASGDAFVTGQTFSTDFPTAGVHASSTSGNGKGFVSELDSGGAIRFSTALGGSDYDSGNGIAVDGSGDAFVTGFTSSTNFPTTPGAYQRALKGSYDAFVTELAAPLPLPVVTHLSSSTVIEGSAAFTLAVTGSNFANDAVVQWGGTALATTYVSNTSLQALVPAALLEAGTVRITVIDQAATSTAVPFTVAEAPLLIRGVNDPRATEDAGIGPFTVAYFLDRNAAAPASDFTATISWGDGSSSTVASGNGLVSLGGGLFALRASHTYAEEARFTLSVAVLDVGGSSLTASRGIQVADAPLTGVVLHNPQATEGIGTGTITVATFTDANSAAPASDFTATVTWGDGTSSAASVVGTGTRGSFAVLAGHTYAEDGIRSVGVQISDVGGASASRGLLIAVADAPLSPLIIANPGATEGVSTGTFTLATFSDANTSAASTDFTAIIRWGDDTATLVSGASGGIVALGGGSFAVLASHTFAQEGSLTLGVEVLDAGHAEVSGRLRTTVADAPLSSLSIQPPAATEGIGTGTYTVATFTDANAGAARTDFRALIAWGDGSASAITGADIVSLGGGHFAIKAAHTYAEEGSRTISVQVFDRSGGASISGTQTLSVAEAPLSGLTIASPKATEGTGTGLYWVATFSDGNPAAPAADFTALIHWGDGTTSMVGAAGLVALGHGQFAVKGSHTYAEEGIYTLSVQILDDGGSSISGSQTIAVADAALSGLGLKNPHARASWDTGTFTVAVFHDANQSAPATDFTALINWGDSSSTVSAAEVVALGHGNFAVKADHTWATQDTYTLSVVVQDVGGASIGGTLTISVAHP
jgi:hypothetical protein